MDSDRQPLVHLCGAESWADAQQCGELIGERDVGFVHLSTLQQVHLPANRLYRGRRDLLLLHIDPGRLSSPLRWEPGVETDPESMKFPHLYGPLSVAAVIDVTDYRPGPDGTFAPASIARQWATQDSAVDEPTGRDGGKLSG